MIKDQELAGDAAKVYLLYSMNVRYERRSNYATQNSVHIASRNEDEERRHDFSHIQ